MMVIPIRQGITARREAGRPMPDAGCRLPTQLVRQAENSLKAFDNAYLGLSAFIPDRESRDEAFESYLFIRDVVHDYIVQAQKAQ